MNMDELRSMAVFARVIEKGSMNAAAQSLGITPSAVSQHLRRLEQRHGVTLLQRTTRKLTLTEAGQLFYQGCAAMLAAARQAEQQLSALRDAPVGELRISAPSGLAGGVLSSALAPLLAANPGLSLRLFFHDEMVDLLELQIDLAIRAGKLKDSSLVARHLADWHFVICASPVYVAKHGLPQTPAELLQHDWVGVAAHEGLSRLQLTRGAETVTLSMPPRISSNNILSARAFVLEGLGLSLQPEPEVRKELAAGLLQPVLSEWSLPELPLWMVTPRREGQPAKVRHAMSALQAALGGERRL
ncbi:LysR family transcriptional regulator [Vogesella indigofera]|uniref:LysR family transcriptional regulator n=1 Tax=Vogesella indigofera TaxID=45465 RepID=A0A495B8G7_VOGIN|nr:LysR family transcriptional regulator [Vogesella indigofera]RKQ57199.1 LysR family transcriptional regulator [Vogesella indigofera]